MGTRSKKDGRLIKTPSGDLVAQQHFESRVEILPPPDELERYEAMHPGTAKIILDSYTAQVNHRMALEDAVIKGDNKRANRGQIISAVLVFVCVLIGGFLIYIDKKVEGLATIIISLGTLLTAFYSGAILRKIERVQKGKR